MREAVCLLARTLGWGLDELLNLDEEELLLWLETVERLEPVRQ